MKKIFFIFIFSLFGVLAFQSASAKICNFSGENYNCPEATCNILSQDRLCPSLILDPCCSKIGVLSGQRPSDINACCKIKHNFTFEGVNFQKGMIIGEQSDDKGSGYCFMDGGPIALTYDIKTFTGYAMGALNFSYKKWGMVCLINAVSNVTDWIFYLLLAFTSLMLVAAAMQISIFAKGDPEKLKKGRKVVVYAFITLIIAVLANLIPSAIIKIIG